jgi:hypothetical protein
MARSRLGPTRVAVLVALGCVSIGGSSGSDSAPEHPTPSAFTAKDVSCDHDQASADAEDTIERVGGLVTDDYVVRFSESTRLGVVALVDGDTTKAFDGLVDTYGVAVVAKVRDDSRTRVDDFKQVRDLVASICD